jgi:putative transport protein
MPELFASFFSWSLELMHQNPVLPLFLILGLGYVIGNIRIGSFSFGSVAGVLFAGIFFGHFGLRMNPGAQAVGFALFIFSVGYQAGPRFFSAIKEDGLKYFALSLVVTVSAVLITLLAARLLQAEPGVSAGLLAGGLTSSPTLAAAQDAVRSGTVAIPAGMESEAVVNNIATAYAITYIFGLTGLITILKYMPRILGLNMAEEAARLEREQQHNVSPSNITARCYQVKNPEFISKTLRDIRQAYCDRIPVLTVIRDGSKVDLQPDDHLQHDDIVELIGPRTVFTSGIQQIGPEIPPQWDLKQVQDTAQIVVTNKEVFGKNLGELSIPYAFGVLVVHITRMGVQLPHSYELTLSKGDVLTVTGTASKIDRFGEYAGSIERDISATDMKTFAFGIAGGVLLGMLSISVGGVSIGLGSAGGLLASGLIIGYLRSIRPTFGRLPEAARWVLMEFGLLLFMAGVGLQAGGNIIETLGHSGPALIIAGIVITVIPIGVAYFFGSKVLKLNPAILMGALTGAMTSGAALSVVTAEAKSAIPAIGYAGTYAFGNVLLMVAGPLVILLG